MIGRRILSTALVKAHSESMETTVRDLKDPAKMKAVTVYLRDL